METKFKVCWKMDLYLTFFFFFFSLIINLNKLIPMSSYNKAQLCMYVFIYYLIKF